MRVFLAGATGAIGRRLLPQLLARHHQVTATTTSGGKVAALRASGAEAIVVDGLDAAAVRSAVGRAEPEAIIHQMTALARSADLKHFDRWFARTNRLRTEGTEHLLAAGETVGTTRFIAQSYTGWPNIREGGPVKTEDDALDPEPAGAQRESLTAIRFLERAVLDASLQGVVLRYGPVRPGCLGRARRAGKKRRMPIVGGGGGVWSWIHVDDAAAATVAALESGPRGIYNIVDDDPATVSECVPHLAAAVGAKPPRHIPAWVGRLVAGEVAVRMMTEARGASNEKARRVLDWQPAWSSWREGFCRGLDDPVHLQRADGLAA